MPLKLDVVTIEREVYSADDVDMVVLPGVEGVMGVLPHHAPVVSALKEGVLEIKRGDRREVIAIGGGFAEVRPDGVIVMADVAEKSDEIDEERAERARKNALDAIASAPATADRLDAMASLRRAEIRLRVSRQRRQPSARDMAG